MKGFASPGSLIRSSIIAIAIDALSAVTSRADSIDFSTAGSFNGSGNSIMFGTGGNTLTVSFTGVNIVDLNDSPFTFSSLGTFQTSTTGTGATIGSPANFSLDITQSQPTAGSGSLLGVLNGTISQNQSTAMVTFSITSITIGAETYALTNNPLPLVPPSTNNGMTTVQAKISGPAVPDSGRTVLLLGSSLIVVFGARRFLPT